MFRLLVSYAIVAAALTGAASAQGILPEGAKWEKVSSAGKAFGEGVVAAKDGSIYLVDLAPPGTLFRYDPKTETGRNPSINPVFAGLLPHAASPGSAGEALGKRQRAARLRAEALPKC